MNVKAAIMRPTLPKLGCTSCLVSILLKLSDTSLAQDDLGNFLQRARNIGANSMKERIVRSGLIEPTAFPTIALCLELVIAFMNRYDVDSRCIRTGNGEFLVEINREMVIDAIGMPHKEAYENWSIGTSYEFL